jgi:hypothetical protein
LWKVKDEMEKINSQRPAIREFDMAWNEYFKSKPNPRNNEEERKELEEFHHWYNFVRKQSDTRKTPVEMYKEIYGKEPPGSPTEVSRIMNFEWDEDYNEELIGLICELQGYDTEEGCRLEYDEVKKKLEYAIKELIGKNEKALDLLHKLLEGGGTWSCLFALEILQKIKNPKSINPIVKFIRKNECKKECNLWEDCDRACRGLMAIGKPAIAPLLLETKKDFSKKKYYGYIIEGFSNIKDDRVYNFLRETLEDYLKDYNKYKDWFEMGHFICGFHEQENKEVLSLIKELFGKDFLTKDDKNEIKGVIEHLENPERYKEELKKLKEECENEFGKVGLK